MNHGNGVCAATATGTHDSRRYAAVPGTNAIVGIDLADRKEMVVVTDHDSKVLARRTFRCKAWDLGAALDWAAERSTRAGYAGGTVACEPTGHRWRVLGQLTAERGMSFVCVQPMLTSWARKSEDLTTDMHDKDAVLIARLIAQLRCYLPEPVDEIWGRLRHLGVRREQLLDEHGACVQQIRDLLECVWPAAWPPPGNRSNPHWVAAMHVIMTRDGGDFSAPAGWAGPVRTRRPQGTHPPRKDPPLPADPAPLCRAGRPRRVLAHRPGAFERISWLIKDWDTARTKLDDTEARMVAVLDDLELTELACSIQGLCPVGAAAILAETGDLHRFTSSRAVVKHAGLAPRERMSGTFAGRARLTGAGRPHLRTAAWRAVWGAVRNNPVYAARYEH